MVGPTAETVQDAALSAACPMLSQQADEIGPGIFAVLS
jgi:hypothetical protein